MTSVPGYQVRWLSWDIEPCRITTRVGEHFPGSRVVDAAETRPGTKGAEPVGTEHGKVCQGVLDIVGRQQRCRWNGLACALDRMLHLFGSQRVGVTCPTADSPKAVRTERAAVAPFDVLGDAWYLLAAQSIGYALEELRQPRPCQRSSHAAAPHQPRRNPPRRNGFGSIHSDQAAAVGDAGRHPTPRSPAPDPTFMLAMVKPYRKLFPHAGLDKDE